MPVFSVGVRDESRFLSTVGLGLTPFSRAGRAYIVEADTARKAKNAVARYLKAVGKSEVCDVWDAIPAEHLPPAKAEQLPKGGRGKTVRQTQSIIPCQVEEPRRTGGGTIEIEVKEPKKKIIPLPAYYRSRRAR